MRDLLEGGASPNSNARRQNSEIFGGVSTVDRGSAVFRTKGVEIYESQITALQVAAAGGHQEVAEVLIKAGALVDATRAPGWR